MYLSSPELRESSLLVTPFDFLTECPAQTLTDRTGTIKSLLYPSNYPNSADCSWTIQGTGNDIIELTFSSFQVEGPAYWCWWDWVKVYDGDTLIGT